MNPAQAAATDLGRFIQPRADAHPGTSGIHALADPREAFAARALLARAAERTLDVQYYIWHGDLTGTLLLQALHAAADRGVRVRLLLDDSGTGGLDTELMALDMHPNIEVRLFNPFVTRRPKWLGYLTDFSRANRRMHSKSFTADGVATIVGGRNIGDEYFGATQGVLFADLDVLAIGPAASEVGTEFDRYWASASAYPVDRMLPPVSAEEIQALTARAEATERDPAATAYIAALRDMASIQRLVAREADFEWVPSRLVSDDPAKGLKQVRGDLRLFDQLRDILGEPQATLDLVSPYFVPTQAGVDLFGELASRGVKVRVLTNALEATDVAAVHAGYAKHRKQLLQAGIELHEMRRSAAPDAVTSSAGPLGSSGSSLHAKTFAVDGARVFVGSFNFDPRSADLNTELGLVIDSPGLAAHLRRVFDTTLPAMSYQVRLDDNGRLYWLEQRGDRTVRHDTEPGTGWVQRAGVSVLSILPIDWML